MSFFGPDTVDYLDCIAEIPWMLFCLVGKISSDNSYVAKKFFDIYNLLAEEESKNENSFSQGKRPSVLLKRLLIHPRIPEQFLNESFTRANEHLAGKQQYSLLFITSILYAWLRPKREKETVIDHIVYFSEYSIVPHSAYWIKMLDLRKAVFQRICANSDENWLWNIIAESHAAFRFHWIQSKQQSDAD